MINCYVDHLSAHFLFDPSASQELCALLGGTVKLLNKVYLVRAAIKVERVLCLFLASRGGRRVGQRPVLRVGRGELTVVLAERHKQQAHSLLVKSDFALKHSLQKVYALSIGQQSLQLGNSVHSVVGNCRGKRLRWIDDHSLAQHARRTAFNKNFSLF